MNRLPVITLVALVVIGASCTSIKPGNDAFVVRAEQAQQAAFDTVDTFLYLEKSNRAAFWALNHGIKKAADGLRAWYPAANATAVAMIKAYKRNRTDTNKANLVTALAVLAQARVEAEQWLAQTGGAQ